MLVTEPNLVILGMKSQEKDWKFCRQLLTFLDQPLLLLVSTENKRSKDDAKQRDTLDSHPGL